MKFVIAQNIVTVASSLVLSVLMLLSVHPFAATGQEQTEMISGMYAGTVAIAEPVPLGVLDLVFDISADNGVLTGEINATRSLIYEGAPTLTGTLISGSDVVTPTFTLNSEVFSNEVSGRQVERSFTLAGEVFSNGDILQGRYEETIQGFTPEPLLITGTFLVVRPSSVVTVSVPPAPNPAPIP